MRRELQEVMYEERAAKLAELEYQRRIQAEKDNNTQMLNTWKSTVNGHWLGSRVTNARVHTQKL